MPPISSEIIKFFPAKEFLPDIAFTHMQVPTPILLNSGLIRVYFAFRDRSGRSHTSFLEVDPEDNFEVTYNHQKSVIELGKLGTFDADGVMVNQVINLEGFGLLLLYTGWSRGTDVPYKTMAGVAASQDGGVTFERVSKGPLLGIDSRDPYFTNTPYLLKLDSGDFNLFYGSGIDWIRVGNKLEPQYQIKIATSRNLNSWVKNDEFIVEPKLDFESNVRPWVDFKDGIYYLYYCYRGTQDFRNGFDSYRIGVSTSKNLRDWDCPTDISFINSKNSKNLLMNAYPAIVNLMDSRKIMFFNGNSFGREGFYLAKVKT
jgi:hypothetical protein